jgi:hypothetical protein
VFEERALLLLGLVAILLAAIGVGQWLASRNRARLGTLAGASIWSTLGVTPDGRQAVVSFSTPMCAACRTAQAPAIEAMVLAQGPAAPRVVRVDASQDPAVAEAFGIYTVPSTVVLSADGTVQAVNQGFASADRLTQQLRAV